MSGLEPLIGIGIAVLNLSVGGVALKDIIPSAIGVGWNVYLFAKRKYLENKMARMLITYCYNKFPHSKYVKQIQGKVKKMFKRYDRLELAKTITYYKEIEQLFYSVNFNDNYWKQYNEELIVNPEKMRNYLIKKVYIQRIKDIIVIKLYNNPLSEEDLTELYNDLVDTFMLDRITHSSLEKLVENMEKQLKLQYLEQRNRYDTDFKDEQGYLMSILQKSMVGLDRTTRTAINEAVSIIQECKNDIDSPNNYSPFLKRSRSLSKTNKLDIVEEELLPKQKQIENTVSPTPSITQTSSGSTKDISIVKVKTNNPLSIS